jgi:hypothetical protein
LLANYIIIALLIRISDSSRRPAARAQRPVPLAQAHTAVIPR